MLVETNLAVSDIPGIRLADVMQQRGPPQYQIGAVFFLFHRLAKNRERVRIDILMLRMLIRFHGHRRNFGEDDLRQACLHEQVNAIPRSCTEDHLVHLYLDALNSDAADFLSHVGHGLTHAVAHPKFQLGNKARARSIRSGSSRKESSGAAGVSMIPACKSLRPAIGSKNSRVPSARSSIAMALTLKSRRIKSSSSVLPNVTSGLRLSPS